MARPCGCAGECGCTILGVNGISASGTGTVRDPKLIGLANPITGAGCDAIMGCVGSHVGSGLRYDPSGKTVAARISGDAGNGIVFGSDSGLYASGAGGGGGGGGVTVDSLPAANIIGGTYGAGFAQWPEGPIETYQAAMAMDDLKVVHVPVRRSAEGYLAAMHHRSLGNYNWRYSGVLTTVLDLKMMQGVWWLPGGDPRLNVETGDVTHDDQGGYFGHGWRDTKGVVRLSDVFGLVQNRKVLYLECKDLGASVSDTVDPAYSLSLIQQQIRQYGAQKAVIVGIERPTTLDATDLDAINTWMTNLKNDGVAIAAHITSSAQAAQHTPASLVAAGYTWALFSYALADTSPATITAYRDAGLQVMLYGGHRQYHWNLQANLGLRGMLCVDPVYCAGKTSYFRYRKVTSQWSWTAPDYGRHGYTADFEGMRDKYRGYVPQGVGDQIAIDGTTKSPRETDPGFRTTSYYILMGEQCPIRDTRVAPNEVGSPNWYDIEVGFVWDALISDRGRHMSIFFGVPEDRPLYEWMSATVHTKGYMFGLGQDGIFTFARYDGIAGTSEAPVMYSNTFESGWGTITPGTEYRVKVRVRPDRIVVGRADVPEVHANSRTYTETSGGGTMWRGAYFYLGRHFFNDNDSTKCRFRNLSLVEGTSV